MNTSHFQVGAGNPRSAHKNFLRFVSTIFFTSLSLYPLAVGGQTRPLSARVAIVVDERLSVLRSAPGFSAPLARRLGRGRVVRILESRRARDGIFYRVAVTRRTRGWIQREAVIAPRQPGEDERLLRLINSSVDFDRLVRARIFLDAFPRSTLRPIVLLSFGQEATRAAGKLSRDAARRLSSENVKDTGAPISSYFLNYSGLDRYHRQGIIFTFDHATKQFHYNGGSWRELLRRYPSSPQASEAKAVGRKQ